MDIIGALLDLIIDSNPVPLYNSIATRVESTVASQPEAEIPSNLAIREVKQEEEIQ